MKQQVRSSSQETPFSCMTRLTTGSHRWRSEAQRDTVEKLPLRVWWRRPRGQQNPGQSLCPMQTSPGGQGHLALDVNTWHLWSGKQSSLGDRGMLPPSVAIWPAEQGAGAVGSQARCLLGGGRQLWVVFPPSWSLGRFWEGECLHASECAHAMLSSPLAVSSQSTLRF